MDDNKVSDGVIGFFIATPVSILVYYFAYRMMTFFISPEDPNYFFWQISLAMIVLLVVFAGFFALIPEEERKRFSYRNRRRRGYVNERGREGSPEEFFE